MIDFTSNVYKISKGMIDKMRAEGQSWDYIRNLHFFDTVEHDDSVKRMLLSASTGINDINVWYEIVDNEKLDAEIGITTQLYLGETMIPTQNLNDFELEKTKGSAWLSYKKTLADKNFTIEDIQRIQTSSHRILNKISLNTTNTDPVKGLVIGNVQSGKTANMAALMAMAADCGWNLFIILSGTIENLRVQTQERLINDLKTATNVAWLPIDHFSSSPNSPYALSKLNLAPKAKQRYINVCLKHSSRLATLLNWASKDLKSREQLRILFIDDEADQAGINTSKEGVKERTRINDLISKMLTNKNENGEEVKTKFGALNYIAYTATPYANILNEKPGPKSTYPSNFVSCLSVSEEYIGPQNIFGLVDTDLDGMNIVNIVGDEDVEHIKKMYNGQADDIPQSLKEAILWFYVCFASKKYWGDTSPTTMLIHTAVKTDYHSIVALGIKEWIGNLKKKDFIDKCKSVYDKQTSIFTKEDFKIAYPKYRYEVKDYPEFKKIENILEEIFNEGISSIHIDESGDFEFTKGVHLCIDNCAHNYIEGTNEHIRLIYPKRKLDYATGFIVVGGATLSRGLTLEGLSCSYFLRTSRQADTLMQMGRWFGYRKNYELLPRIWMTERTQSQFKFLSVLDYRLREEMMYMEKNGLSPKQVGIRILYHPLRSFLSITTKNKMKDSKPVELDFSGVSTQTTMFYEDVDILRSNLKETEDFILKLGKCNSDRRRPHSQNSFFWDNVDKQFIMDYISKMQFPKNDITYLDVKLFENWYRKIEKKQDFSKWNVVVTGLENVKDNSTIKLANYDISLVNRSRKKLENSKEDGCIRIGVLRAPKDLYIDVDLDNQCLDKDDMALIETSNYQLYETVRDKTGLSKTPLLVIYVINKDSKNDRNSKYRVDLNAKEHVVGLMINIPHGSNKVSDSYVSIDLSNEVSELEKEDIENA